MNLFFAAEGGGDIFAPEPGFLIWSAITFAILIGILWKLAWGPLTKMIEEREQKIRDDIESADKARAEAEASMALHKKQLDEAANEAKKILEDAREAGERARQGIIADAESTAEALKVKAEKDIAAARDKAVADLKGIVVDIALEISEKVVTQKMDASEHEKLAGEVLAKAGDLN